jgi:uncharacterized phage-like protein YoqJ
MILAFTGHRPDKLPDKKTGYKIPNPTYLYIYCEISKALKKFEPEKVISGMALGVDQVGAMVAHRLGIPFIAAIPFEGQEKMWPEKSQRTYQALLNKASEVVIVSPGGYAANKMQIRNEWMVNHCDLLIGVWNGDQSGGTYNCLEYAKSVGKEIYCINPKDAPETSKGEQ